MNTKRNPGIRLLETPSGSQIAYQAERRRRPAYTESGVFWLGGFKSSMDGAKAAALAQWSRAKGHECVRFDYSGHGASGGRFEDGTISLWLEEAAAVFDEITTGPQILIGSSMGGWLALLLLRRHLAHGPTGDSRVRGVVLLAPAVDMTERLMWDGFSDAIKREIMETGACNRPSDYDDGPYPITRKLIEDGRNHLILDQAIEVPCPVRILQGLKDPDVPWRHAVDLAEALNGDDITVTLIKDGDHRLSEDRDILRLVRTVDALAALVDKKI